MPANTVEITVTTLTYGGEAMGRLPDGRACFIPFALPGEIVRACIIDDRKNFARAELLEVISPAPERITPRCNHFGKCGGCHYQHLPYAAQLNAKREILKDQLQRIGKITNPNVLEMIPAPAETRYRNNIQFHLDETGKPGFMTTGFPPAVFPINECHLPENVLNDLWPQMAFEPGTGIERVSLRAGHEAMLILESDFLQTPELELESEISVVHLAHEHAVIMAGDDHIIIPVLGRPFHVSAGSFFQVNTQMAETMVNQVLGLLPENITTLLDVYCGVGLFSAFLAPRCRQLIGIELSPSACEDFAINLDEFDHVDIYEALAEDVLPALDVSPQAILLDPPRAGLEKPALNAILEMQAPIIVYVSCDPSTLARDASRLIAGGYDLEKITPIDMFPQTYHIESISLFNKN